MKIHQPESSVRIQKKKLLSDRVSFTRAKLCSPTHSTWFCCWCCECLFSTVLLFSDPVSGVSFLSGLSVLYCPPFTAGSPTLSFSLQSCCNYPWSDSQRTDSCVASGTRLIDEQSRDSASEAKETHERCLSMDLPFAATHGSVLAGYSSE